jgi:hypothetical protein
VWTKTGILILSVSALAVVMLFLRSRTSGRQESHAATSRLALPKPDPARLEIRGFEFYVRLEPARSDKDLQTLAAAVGDRGTIYRRSPWAVVLWDDFFAPDALLREISGSLTTQVIWLSFQKQVDAFELQHWEKGQLKRRLTFGCYEKERTWEKVEGQPEAWEAAALFDPTDLQREIGFLKEYPPEGKTVAAAEAELSAIWSEHRLSVDSQLPNITGRDAAEAVAVAYSLPGWE